jgi:hypothetical protein
VWRASSVISHQSAFRCQTAHIITHRATCVSTFHIAWKESQTGRGEKKRKIDTRLQPPKKTWFVVCHSVHDGECQATRRNFEINTVVSSAAPPVCYLLVSSQGLCLEFLTPKQKRVFFFFFIKRNWTCAMHRCLVSPGNHTQGDDGSMVSTAL